MKNNADLLIYRHSEEAHLQTFLTNILKTLEHKTYYTDFWFPKTLVEYKISTDSDCAKKLQEINDEAVEAGQQPDVLILEKKQNLFKQLHRFEKKTAYTAVDSTARMVYFIKK